MTAKSVIIVADGDPSVPRAIADALPEGFEVVPCTTAHGALNACCAIEPHCLVTEFALGECDALWLASTLRAQTNYAGLVPVVMLAASLDEELAVAALRSGVDVVVSKPFVVLELVAQLRALIAMASRFGARPDRGSRPSLAGITSDGRARAMVGDLDRMPVATILGALELERCTGELRLRPSRSSARQHALGQPGAYEMPVLALRLVQGLLTGGNLGALALSPLDALTEALHYNGKHFEFVPEPDRPYPAGAEAIGPLLVRAVSLPAPSTTRTRSGTQPRVVAMAPGRALVESMAPASRPDPRAEPRGSAIPPMHSATVPKPDADIDALADAHALDPFGRPHMTSSS